MAITFDGASKLIVLDATEVTVSTVWSRWVDWYLTGTNSKWEPAMRFVGGDPMTAEVDLGVTYFMINGWRIRPMESDHWLSVTGNLFTDPAGQSPFVATLGDFNVVIQMNVSNVVEIRQGGGGGGEGPHDNDILANTASILAGQASQATAVAVADLDADLVAVAADVADVLGDTDQLVTNLNDLHSDVAAVASAQGDQALEASVTDLAGDLSDLAAAVAALPDPSVTLTLIRKLLTNKTVEDDTGVDIYEDNGVTLLGRWSWSEATKTRGKLA